MNSLGPLLSQLEATELPTHLQHLRVRLSRQFAQLLTSPEPLTQHEQHIRLQSRLDEIESELREGATAEQGKEGTLTERARRYLALAEQVKSTREQLEQLGRKSEPSQKPARSQSQSRDASSSPEPRPRKTRPSAAHLEGLPPPTIPSKLFDNQTKALHRAYTLHQLATKPSSILPPGVSLASVFRDSLTKDPSTTPSTPSRTSVSAPTPPPTFEERVADMARGAYFAQAVEDILDEKNDSSSSTRTWKRLRLDLWEAVKALVPSRLGGGVVKRELEAALTGDEATFDIPPATKLLKGLVETLGTLCAPARDPEVQSIVTSLEGPEISVHTLVQGVKLTLQLAEGMSQDLQGFRSNLAAALHDDELVEVATRNAMETERKVVKEMLREGDDIVEMMERWVKRKMGPLEPPYDQLQPREKGRYLVQALWSALLENQPIAIPPHLRSGLPSPIEPRNAVPPVFYVPAPRIFALQNLLQAIVIIACLDHLLPPSPPLAPSASPPPDEQSNSPRSRLWTLLTATADASSAPEDWSHLDHMSDEISAAWIHYRANPLPGAPPPPPVPDAEAEKTRIRSALDRIIRYGDPVYSLMQQRLGEILKRSITVNLAPKELPSDMRSGRQAPSLATPHLGRGKPASEWRVVIAGYPAGVFSRPEMKERIREAATEGWRAVKWAADVWGEEVGFEIVPQSPAQM